MDTAGFGAPGTYGKVDEPWGHKIEGEKVKAFHYDNPPAIAPGGNVHCSLGDLARFTMMHLQGEKKGSLLKPETFRKLHTPPGRDNYACGWVCELEHHVENSHVARTGKEFLGRRSDQLRWVGNGKRVQRSCRCND